MATTETLYDQTPNIDFPQWILHEKGKLIELSGNRPLLLDNPHSVWIVVSGKVDVFAIHLENGDLTGTRHHLLRANTGEALFGMPATRQGREIALLASSVPGTSLLELERARLFEIARDPHRVSEIALLLGRWIFRLAKSTTTAPPPQQYTPLQIGDRLALEDGCIALPPRGMLWAKHTSGNSMLHGCHKLSVQDASGFLPVCKYTWLQAIEPSTLHVIDTETFVRQEKEWSALDRFHSLVQVCLDRIVGQEKKAERTHLRQKAASDQRILENALSQLGSVLEKEKPVTPLLDEPSDPLFVAIKWVGQAMGLTIRPPVQLPDASSQDKLQIIAAASQARVRKVMLRQDWWHNDNIPLLAFYGQDADRHPVALLPVSLDTYEIHDPVRQIKRPITPQIADQLSPFAYRFYRPLPNRVIDAWELFKFGVRGCIQDLWMVLLWGILGGFLNLFVPLATGWVFDDIIPSAEQGQLVQVFAALLISALAGAVFQFARSIAILRAEIRMSATVQSGIWDRLLSLPVSFFRNYSAGDLSSRAMGLDRIRRELSGPTLTTLLSSLFSTLNLGLLFYYNARLAWIAIGLIAIAAAVTLLLGYVQTRSQREITELHGRLSGIVLQFVTGISKLRVAAAEGRAFAFWAQQFSEQKRQDYQSQKAAGWLTVFHTTYPLLNSIVVFAMLALSSQITLSPGSFVAFYAAFGQFLSAGLHMSAAWVTIWNLLPKYERTKPILHTLPEVNETQADPGVLSGAIEVEHAYFRYAPDTPLVLQDISLTIHPGEFVAIVGKSGSGKSTLLRLLLGFETPESGEILYDGQPLEEIDVRAVRRQVGVVLQNSKLMSSDILTNIIGSSLLTLQDAWEAARMVGMAQDIEQMPMGMYTIVSEGGSNLSGGQRQRLLIARAIVHKPRILFFDEATSALDNTTQAIVSHSLERLQSTRVVIAHRLSTIVKADQIFVLDKGVIVQSGTYQELIQQDGAFARLAERQLV